MASRKYNPLEAKVEERFVHGCMQRGGRAVKLVFASGRGWPDRTCFMPAGVLLLVELKRPRGGRLLPWQGTVHKWLTKLGFVVHILWTIEEVEDFWRRYDDIRPTERSKRL